MPTEKNAQLIPILPLRDVVVYPYMVIPLFVGRPKSIKALDVAMAKDKQVLLVAQRTATEDQPEKSDLYQIGAVATILQLLKLPDGTVKVLVEGTHRGRIIEFSPETDCFLAKVDLLDSYDQPTDETSVVMRSLKAQFEQYVKLNRKIPTEVLGHILAIEDPGRLGDTIAAHVVLKLEHKQQLLETMQVNERNELLMGFLEEEISQLMLEKKIRARVKKQMEKTQREYYLNEQMKAIQKELNEVENIPNEMDMIEKKIKESGMSEEASKKAFSELKKLREMPMQSAEGTVIRNYLDHIIALPWNKFTNQEVDLITAKKILDVEHYGLEEVKDRILEYIAVSKRVTKMKGPILCLVGPPGVGKTSLGKSIAKAVGREFVRMSLGGVRDEAEIRGHRRTYIGAMPGKPLQKLEKCGVNNPLFLLDEIDKMAMDFRGDPASALLEVLDPEQNHNFSDHYIDVDFDLSKVMFMATANTLNIPPALKDRMEIIRISGYTEDEKTNIAMQHLIPKQLEATGLKSSEIQISEEVVREIIRHYTRESGVRSLERELAKLCRKVVKDILLKKAKKTKKITSELLEEYLGVPRYRDDKANQENQIGQVKGLAWTEVGGELLTIETVVTPGKGKTTSTGQLGGVMQESIQAALTVVKARSAKLGIPKNYFDKHDIHIHVPEGATPKDGPSAGISMCTALVSAAAHLPVRADYAMTGEITLRGEVLPIGGLKEKLLAAHRTGIRHVIIPQENVKDLKEIPDNVKQSLDIQPVRWIDEVLTASLDGYSKKAKGKTKKVLMRTLVARSAKIKGRERGRKNLRDRAH